MKFDRLRPVQRRRLLWALRAFSWVTSAGIIWTLIAIGRHWDAMVWLAMALAFEALSAWGRTRSRSAVALRRAELDWERLQGLRQLQDEERVRRVEAGDYVEPSRSVRAMWEGEKLRVTHINGRSVEEMSPDRSGFVGKRPVAHRVVQVPGARIFFVGSGAGATANEQYAAELEYTRRYFVGEDVDGIEGIEIGEITIDNPLIVFQGPKS